MVRVSSRRVSVDWSSTLHAMRQGESDASDMQADYHNIEFSPVFTESRDTDDTLRFSSMTQVVFIPSCREGKGPQQPERVCCHAQGPTCLCHQPHCIKDLWHRGRYIADGSAGGMYSSVHLIDSARKAWSGMCFV